MTTQPSAILRLHCPDRKGIVAAVSGFISEHGGNILHFDQHVDAEQNILFLRAEWSLETFDIGRDGIEDAFRPIVERFEMDHAIRYSDHVPRVAIFVSKYTHCLIDLLARHQSGDLPCEIPMVISNHEDVRELVESFRIPFHHIPVTRETKEAREREEIRLMNKAGIDLVVMARYMQILSPLMIDAFPMRIINVHHSFLPAFPGGKPYHQAFARGVKLIGATSHYATENLDQGPIIDQDTIPVSHEDSIPDLIRHGKDLEKRVLARAVYWHLQRRILVYNNKTVVFR